MTLLEMLIRVSALTILFLALLLLVAGTLFVINVCILEWYGVDIAEEVKIWITKHSKRK